MEGAWWVTADELDPDQKRLIEIPRDGKYLVLGPPGRETNILILRAADLIGSGLRNILVVTFTRALKEFIEAGAHNRYRLPRNLFTTFANWSEALREARRRINSDGRRGDRFHRARMRRIEELRASRAAIYMAASIMMHSHR